MKKKKILVIEDFLPMQEEIVGFLKMEGFSPLASSDGAEGVQMAILHQPDLIICDIQMPKMDGYQVYKALENIPNTVSIPFIFLTAFAQPSDFRKGLELGADDYLTKPFKLDALLMSIKKRLEKHERYLTQANNKFNAIMSNPLVGTYIYDGKKLTVLSEKATEITSYTRLEMNNAEHSKIIIENREEFYSDFRMCMMGLHDTFRRKISLIKKDKKVIFLEVFGRHIISQNQTTIIGTIIEHKLPTSTSQNTQTKITTPVDDITLYLQEAGKTEIADAITNAQQQLQFKNENISNNKKDSLSEREKEVLLLICQGFTNAKIAEKLFISPRTVDNHRSNLLLKTGAKNTASLVAIAIKYQIIDY